VFVEKISASWERHGQTVISPHAVDSDGGHEKSVQPRTVKAVTESQINKARRYGHGSLGPLLYEEIRLQISS
jgi:hypothetical protein